MTPPLLFQNLMHLQMLTIERMRSVVRWIRSWLIGQKKSLDVPMVANRWDVSGCLEKKKKASLMVRLKSTRVNLWPRVITRNKKKIRLYLFTCGQTDHHSSVTLIRGPAWSSHPSDGRYDVFLEKGARQAVIAWLLPSLFFRTSFASALNLEFLNQFKWTSTLGHVLDFTQVIRPSLTHHSFSEKSQNDRRNIFHKRKIFIFFSETHFRNLCSKATLIFIASKS